MSREEMKKISDGDTAWTIVDVAHQINAILAANGVTLGLTHLDGTIPGEGVPSIVVGKAEFSGEIGEQALRLVATVEENPELWDVS